MNLLHWIPVFILSAASESTMQICLKKGATENSKIYGIKYYLKLIINKWVILGVLVYGIDMVLWIVVLMYIPLSVAFPMTGIQKIFVIFFALFVLKEKISKSEWIGLAFITAGLSVIVMFE